MIFSPDDPNPDAYTAFRFPVTQFVTGLLMATIAGTFAVQIAAGEGNDEIIRHFGAIPVMITGQTPHEGPTPVLATLLTAQFLHGGWDHLLSNLFFLWLFGGAIERNLGRSRYLLFYLIVGAVATLAEVAIHLHSDLAVIGASAGISGILAAALLHRPFAVVTITFLYVPFRFPTLITVGGWAILQVFGLSRGADGNIAFVAHLSGFVAGAVLFAFLRVRDVVILD